MIFLLAELLKALGVISSATAAIVAVFSPDTTSVKDGKLTQKGKRLIGFALVGLATALGAQVAQVINAIDSAEKRQKQHEETARTLSQVANRVDRGSLASTPLRRFTLICYFDETINGSDLQSTNDFVLSLVFIRGGQAEFRLSAYPTQEAGAGGFLQFEGREQFVTIPLEAGAKYAGINSDFHFLELRTASFWVDISCASVTEAFRGSLDGSFEFWPYNQLGDFADVWFLLEMEGRAAGHLKKAFLRFNEDFVVELPVEVGSRGKKIEDVLGKIQKI